MTLKERWHSEMSAIGFAFHSWISWILMICAVVGGSVEYIANLPQDWIPQWIKVAVVVMSIAARVGGKLTVAKEQPTAVDPPA